MIIMMMVKALDMAVLDPLAAFREDREKEPDAGYPELTADMKLAIPTQKKVYLKLKKSLFKGIVVTIGP